MSESVDYKQLVNAVGDAIMVSDPEGIITLWNPAAERIFGYTEKEAIGQSLDIIIPDRQQKVHWDGYHKTMETGQTRYGTSLLKVPSMDKQGNRLSIAFTVALLYSEDKKVTGIIAVVRDETERFQEERKLRKRASEAELALSKL